jgi:predicted nucleic acid-binding protein
MRKRVNGKPSKRSREGLTGGNTYWLGQIQQLGRNVFYVDTSAILECLNPNDELFNPFFDRVVGGRLVTSSYVVAETVRRLVKSKHNEFIGPGGIQHSDLAVHFLRRWLEERDVSVLYVPQEVFGAARTEFEREEGIGCDLTDVISYVIVVGLQQTRIVSKDRRHFQSFALTCLP